MGTNEITRAPRLILGSGRSGTTWVLDCLADANRLRPIFEPLHPGESPHGERYAYSIMLPDDRDESLEGYFKSLTGGEVSSRWIDYRGRRDYLFPSPIELLSVSAAKRCLYRWRTHLQNRIVLRQRVRRVGTLIKCIRANLMAGWFARTVGFRTVLVVRHPCAAVESQYRLGATWDPKPITELYRANRRLHEITGGRYRALLDAKLTTLQALTLNWVIENQWPVERSLEEGYGVVHYEDLLAKPTFWWRRVCDQLDLPFCPTETLLRIPSQQASMPLLDEPGLAQAERGWRARLTDDQLDAIQGILDATKCDLYHVDSIEPKRARIHEAV